MSSGTGIIIPSEDSPTSPGSLTSDDSQSSISSHRNIEIRSNEQESMKNRLKRKRDLSSGGLEERAQLSRSEVEPAKKKSKDEVISDLQEQVRFLRDLKHQSDLQAVNDYNRAQQILDKLHEQIVCPICYTNTVDIVASWCGHAFCESCIYNGEDTTWERECATCRTRAGRKRYIPLYLI